MTKKIAWLVFCLLLMPSLTAIAQERSDDVAPRPMEIYAKWKAQTFGESGEVKPHHALVAVTQRFDDTSARIDSALIGDIPGGYTLKIVPLVISTDADGKPTETTDGEETIATVTAETMTVPSGLTTFAKVTSQTNALKLQWIIKRGKPADENSEEKFALSVTTVIVHLKNEPHSNVTAIMRGK